MDKEAVAAATWTVINTLGPLTTTERNAALKRLISHRQHWFTLPVMEALRKKLDKVAQAKAKHA